MPFLFLFPPHLSHCCPFSPCQWLSFKHSHLPRIGQHIFSKINKSISSLPSCLSSSFIYLLFPYHPLPIYHPLISPLDPSIHHCGTILWSKASFQQSGPHEWGRELAKSTGPEPEQRSWAAHAQISPSSEWHWSSPVPRAPAGGEEIRPRGRSRLRP